MQTMTDGDLFLDQPGLFEQEQIRLAKISVFNWGSFHGLHTAPIDEHGTLVTGDNGAGKSTLIDGLMALFMPAGKASFNVAAAQGDKADRSFISYMRGSFGSAHDGTSTRVKNKRDKSVVTGLSALYSTHSGTHITLAALYWTTQASNTLSDVKRLYLVAKRNLALKEILDAFGDGNVRQLKQWLRNDPDITCCDDNFSDYQVLYRKLLHMDNKNAPALLSRALGLKKIDDLTKLIRELVLEPSSVRQDARQVVDEFVDLVAIHERLVDAREQVSHLQRLPELAKLIEKLSLSLECLLQEKLHLSVYFGEAFAKLWAQHIKSLNNKLETLIRTIAETDVKEQDATKMVEQCHEHYLHLGGDKIESLKSELSHIINKLEDVARTATSYQHDCQQLDLNANLTDTQFQQNQQYSAEKLASIEEETKRSQDHFGEVAALLSDMQQSISAISKEIEAIEARPDSNIDIKYQRLRDDIIDSLQLPPSELMFIGELIDVKSVEHPWQGAIERALGGLRTTLLLPKSSYAMVTRWLNTKHTGLHVRVQVVLDYSQPKATTQFLENGFLKKLVWREHPYREWLKKHLEKFDLQCVADTQTLDRTPFSMTQQGLMHKERGRFEKKDQSRIDDKRQWQLGFSNKSRLSLLNADKQAAENNLRGLTEKLATARAALNHVVQNTQRWERIRSYQWDAINVPYWEERVATTRGYLKQLEASGNDLSQAKNRWIAAKDQLKSLQNQKGDLLLQKGRLDQELENAESSLTQAQALAAPGLPADVRALLHDRIGNIHLEDTSKQSQIEKSLDEELEKIRGKKSHMENTANGIMSSFRGREKWQPLTVDWPTGLIALADYLEYFATLEKEGLPQLVDQFKERLNKHATQSLARIKTKLESEREDILERIEVINQVLQKTEFKQGSYLRLGSKRERYPHVVEFDRMVKGVFSQVTSDDHEARFKQLAAVVDILEKASAPGTANNKESLRLLDPRYQMSFYAEERDTVSDEVKDVLDSTNAKSGGEKEAFSGTIVAASLAYVLTPEGHSQPIYSTVFLDEAFSNLAENFARRTLRVFKKLNLHVNLITPYEKLNVGSEAARSLLIVERDAECHESRLCEVTWEEIARRKSAASHAARLREA